MAMFNLKNNSKMTSKTKSLKKGTYKPGNATPAPAKAENEATKVASVNHYARDARKEATQRSRARRLRSLMKLGLSKDEIEKLLKKEEERLVLCMYYTSFQLEKGVKKKTIYKRDSQHRVIGTEEIEVPNILRGREAVEEALKQANITPLRVGEVYCYVKTTKNDLDTILEALKPIGRTSVTKPEPISKESMEKEQKAKMKAEQKKNRKPSNNTDEVKKAAKAKRKEENMRKAAMRPYYAALRKGGVSARIKKFNKTLADKIEKWIAEKKKADAEKAQKDKEYRAKHRQLTSLEMKANKRARKAAKHLAAQERRIEREKKRAVENAKALEKRAQKAKKPVQSELKMAA